MPAYNNLAVAQGGEEAAPCTPCKSSGDSPLSPRLTGLSTRLELKLVDTGLSGDTADSDGALGDGADG